MSKFDKIVKIIETNERGVFKRIDENRELLEFLLDKTPEILKQNPWVIGWLESQDKFLTDLAEATNATNPFKHAARYPRDWPIKPNTEQKDIWQELNQISFNQWCKHYGYDPTSLAAKTDYQRYLDELESFHGYSEEPKSAN